ncbi:MAG TPA: ABC transporter permease [Steroidobacteraceae bacterium]|jgi:ribose/xylose/arabinose/galactoside ABC-type transport system permease subunit
MNPITGTLGEGGISSMLRRSRRDFALSAVLIALSIFFTISSPYFLSLENISNLLLSVSVIGTMAAVGTLVVVGRGIDLSLGSICALAGMVTALLIENYHWPWSAGIAAGLAAGAVCGAVNGATVAWIGINPIITTIGTLSIFRGFAFVLSDGQPILIQSDALLYFGAGRLLGLPLSVWLLAVIFVIMKFVAYSTRIGRSIYAIGASPRAALVAGLNVLGLRFLLFVVSGISAALAGILMIGQAGSATPSAASGYELWVITAILLGGTSLSGGQGSVVRTALGVLIIGVLNNGMVLLSVPTFYQIIANGLLLLMAVIVDQLQKRRGSVGAEL